MNLVKNLISMISLLFLASVAQAQMLEGDHIPTDKGDLVIHPVNHATFVMSWDNKTIYVDPVGGVGAFDGLPRPDLILITDIHGDHLDGDTVTGLAGTSLIIAPEAVKEQLPGAVKNQTRILDNDNTIDRLGISIEAIPMYNTTADRLQYHEKGRGNGYVLTLGGKRVYISGDTEDIPEMRALKNIDVAFVCFNLPYTMTENQAASAVNAFKPKIVYPYHYRGSDVDLFASLVDDGIEVRKGAWY